MEPSTVEPTRRRIQGFKRVLKYELELAVDSLFECNSVEESATLGRFEDAGAQARKGRFPSARSSGDKRYFAGHQIEAQRTNLNAAVVAERGLLSSGEIAFV